MKPFENVKGAKIKIAVCVLMVLMIGIIKDIVFLLPLSALVMVVLAVVRKRNGIKGRTLFYLLFFSAVLGLVQAFSLGTHILYEIKLLFIRLYIYQEGLRLGFTTFLKVSCSMGIVLLLLRSIKLGDFMAALRWYRLPQAFIEVMTFTIKFIYIFKEEAVNVKKAQKCRLGYKGFCRSVVSVSSIAGIVLSRAYDRSKALSKSMRSRGYYGST